MLKPVKKNDSEYNMHYEYFHCSNELIEKYGENSVVLMQVGSFFEIYGLKSLDSEGDIGYSNIVRLSEVCNLNISEKTSYLDVIEDGENKRRKLVMAGFRDYTIDKYLSKLTDAGYTAAVYIQQDCNDKKGKKIRVLEQIYSPGTYISYDNDNSMKLSNNIMCIWLERFTSRNKKIKKNILVSGACAINIFTGEVYTFQTEIDYCMNISTFDELEKFVSIYNPSEVIIISDFTKEGLSKVVQYSNINTSNIHFIDFDNGKVEKSKSQKYMKEIISKIYDEQAYEICNDFTEYMVATQSMCYLLDFLQEHNPKLINKLQLPKFNNVSTNVLLANHTLSQLNIISDNSFGSQTAGKYSSVMIFLNKCCTAMGKRMFQYQITHPTINTDWLNNEYDMIEELCQEDYYSNIIIVRKEMGKIRDMDKALRQLVLKSIYPNAIYNLYEGNKSINKVLELIKCDKLNNYLYEDYNINLTDKIEKINRFLENHFQLDYCQMTSSMTVFSNNIIQNGISLELDNLQGKYNLLNRQLHVIKDYFNVLYKKMEIDGIVGNSSRVLDDKEFIKIHETEKSGYTLQLTTIRSNALKKYIDSMKEKEVLLELDITINLNEVKFTKASTSNVDINIKVLQDTCQSILKTKVALNTLIGNVYQEVLSKLEDECFNDIEMISKCASKLDVIVCKTYVANENKYYKPTIDVSSEKSYLKAKGLRHCLIEKIQENEIYVENDISLGVENEMGILLYGTNAVGKTSLIRAIGVAVIIAQCGMYVPCSSFLFKPYNAIFSRILGNDNLFKGLSTFAVEMSELRTIINLSDENSLVLGDELCSGTETESALSIFAAGLKYLYKNESSFIFATHFHEIIHFDEISEMNKLSLKHLEVSYDAENECLVYDRKLKEGSGPRIYGLEVCKSLYMNNDFLEDAFNIRNKYFPEARGILSGGVSKYNATKVRGMCEICNEQIGSEVHHLQQQKDADDKGFINNFHKNHKANLISICEKCHDNIHSGKELNSPTKKKKTTKGMKIY